MRRGVFPGSFNPLTVGHLDIARAARDQRSLDVVVLTVSRVALAKDRVNRPRFEDRIAVLVEEAAGLEWLEVAVTDAQLVADIATGYDVVILGADKWHQIHEPRFYGGSELARDRALASLPEVAVAPRPGFDVPTHLLIVPSESVAVVSSTGARTGRADWMSAAARRFDEATGAWTDPARYGRWLSTTGKR